METKKKGKFGYGLGRPEFFSSPFFHVFISERKRQLKFTYQIKP